MKKVIFTFLASLCLGIKVSQSQDATRISLNTQMSIFTADIAYYGNTTVIGYNILGGLNAKKFGLFLIDNTHTISNSKFYSINGNDINIIKILPLAINNNKLHVLAAYKESGERSSPVIIEINASTGGINWAKKLIIPSISSYTSFFPQDISISTSNSEIKILATGTKSSGTPISEILILDFNLSTFGYTINYLHDPNHLNAVFSKTSFIKSAHYSTETHATNVGLSGIVTYSSTSKGFVYEKDVLNNEYYKTFFLDNQNTIGFQVNGSHDPDPSLDICIQNTDKKIALHKPIDIINPTLTWTKFYNNTDQNFWLTNFGQGRKSSQAHSQNYFIGYYEPQVWGQSDGYGFLRINSINGIKDQNFYWDLNLDITSPLTSYYNYYTDICSILAPGALSFGQNGYLYLIEKKLADSPDPLCTTEIPFTETTGNLLVEDHTMSRNTVSPFIATDVTLIVSDITAQSEIICSDILGRSSNALLPKPGNLNNIQIVTSPARSIITSNVGNIKRATMFSTDGQLIAMQTYSQGKSVSLNFIKPLLPGIYIAKVNLDNGSIVTQKFFIGQYFR